MIYLYHGKEITKININARVMGVHGINIAVPIIVYGVNGKFKYQLPFAR